MENPEEKWIRGTPIFGNLYWMAEINGLISGETYGQCFFPPNQLDSKVRENFGQCLCVCVLFCTTKSTFPFKTTGTKCWFKICVDGFPIDFYWQPKAIIPWRMLAVKIYALGDCTCLNLEINFSHSFSSSQLVTARDTLHGLRSVNFIWLVVSTPLTNIKVSWEYCSICIWTTYTSHVPNHQPVIVIPSYSHWNHH